MINKKTTRLRRAKRARAKQRELLALRLSVHRTLQHIYAQIIDSKDASVVVSTSTLDKTLRDELKGKSGNREAAALVGKRVAALAKEKGIEQVAFDRSGFKYHGRVKALADAAREAGLTF